MRTAEDRLLDIPGMGRFEKKPPTTPKPKQWVLFWMLILVNIYTMYSELFSFFSFGSLSRYENKWAGKLGTKIENLVSWGAV
jgi:hypothetical protein